MRSEATRRKYEGQLRKVGRLVGKLTEESPLGDLAKLLRGYAEALRPWAQRTAWRMLQDVDDATLRTWSTLARDISQARRRELMTAPVGPAMGRLLAQQVEAITSIPQAAAERVVEMSRRALLDGTRAKEIAEEIRRGGEVARGHANMLARTAVTSAATELVMARAQYAGSEAYVWETARDSAVRDSHREMQGKVVRWDAPPTIDGYAAHAGQFANCRCWCRPILGLE